MTGPPQDQSVLVVGGQRDDARLALASRDSVAQLTAAGRDRDALAAVYPGEPLI